MASNLCIIWDYDGAAGNINASYPYQFDESKLLREIANVETILNLGQQYGLTMTFACVGFGAEPGTFPYHIPEQIQKIFALGHEIASHSWRHEWFPYLTKEQIRRSLARSKSALEACIGEPGTVQGFILPFSRPMTWWAKGALSLGDRVFGPWYPGADLGAMLRFIGGAGYRWSRISYRPVWQKLIKPGRKQPDLTKAWPLHRGVVCVPSHIFGFDAAARNLLTRVSQRGGDLVVSAHPAALSFGREESLANFEQFARLAAHYQAQGLVKPSTVSNHLTKET